MANWLTLRSKVSAASGDQPPNSEPSPPKQIVLIRACKPLDVLTATSTAGAMTSSDEKTSGSKVVSSSNPTTLDPKAQKNGVEGLKDLIAETIAKMARFGPTYGKDTEANTKAKESAWKHIAGEEAGEGNLIKDYLNLIKGMEEDIVKCYDTSNFDEKKLKRGKEFRMAMVRDGCFFLQLALHILGAGPHLNYQDQNPYFGSKVDSAFWIPHMFFVGNQIPYNVIDALMKQPFFQEVIKKGVEEHTWKRPPVDDLAKLALYLTVVEPHLQKQEKPNRFLFTRDGVQQPPPDSSEKPSSDILSTLRNLVLKSRWDTDDPAYHEMKDFQDLEANYEGKDMKIPSAGELLKLGIKLVKGEPGISNIRFENRGYSAFLYVPPFTIDAHSEKLLFSLANHELALNDSERELTAYLRFMRDLSPTYKDFKILEQKRIIIVKGEGVKGTMVRMLDTIVSQHNSNYTLNFRQIRRKVNDYGGPPWRLISFCLGVLAVVQTIFTVLSYAIPRG